MTESLNLFTLLLFTMPGFFFLRGMGYKTDSDFIYLVYSMFWGILMMALLYNRIFPLEQLNPLLQDPYAGAIVFSIVAWLLGRLLKFLSLVRPRFPIEF